MKDRREWRERHKLLKDKDHHGAQAVHQSDTLRCGVGVGVDSIGTVGVKGGVVGGENKALAELAPAPVDKKTKVNGHKLKLDTRLSASWTLPAEWASWCASTLRWPHAVTVQTAKQFHDYWLGAPGPKGVKRDWFATWRNWCREEQRRIGRAFP